MNASGRFAGLALAALCAVGTASGALKVRDGETIAFLGDSITQYGQAPDNAGGYVNLVLRGLEAEGVRVKAIKAGISGHKSNQMLARLNGILRWKPQWLTLSCGVNDVWHQDRGKGVLLEDYKSNIAAILDTCAASNCQVVVLTATPFAKEREDAGKNAKLAPYNAWLREEAARRGLPLADLNARMWEILRKDPSARLTRDGVHMAPAGDRVMAKGVLEALGFDPADWPKVERGTDELPPIITNCEIRSNPKLAGKKAFYYCDDVIWLFRDLTRQKPKSLFENPFLKLMKEAHDKYGFKVQLNCFYRLDFFYGTDEFTLAEMTDAYKAEWQANKDWLRLGFHSLQEFPDYPFINANYRDMKRVLDLISGEILRFAGEGVFAKGAVVHWGTCSKDACRALRDAGFGIVLASCGPRKPYGGDPSVLPYGHAMRLEQNRKPETCLYTRISENEAIASSLGGYNNLTYDQAKATYGSFKYVYDREIGIGFKELEDFQPLAAGINLYTMKNLVPTMEKYAANEFFVYGNHEQYFYRDYLAYQPEYGAKILAAAKFLKEHGYEYFFLEELAK